MLTPLIDLINMQTSLICKLFSLYSVTPLWPTVAWCKKHGDEVNNLNPFSLDEVKQKNMAAGVNNLNPFS